ncbi:MAG: hypothetical protein Q4D62_13195, partial [Planctomycetia bacterium]|nr:hypothetical protein [Planctomycetia bacterium]
MRSESELMNYAGMYDFQKDSPFQMPDENILLPVDGNPMEKGQMVMDWDKLPVSADGQMDAGAAADRSRTGSKGDESPATNRGFARYQGKLYPDRWGGYDGGVEASIHGKWEYGALERLAARLEICKMAADNGEVNKKYIDLAGIIWEVKPTGASSGFFKYKWVIESHGVKVYIHSSGKKGVIPVRVRFGFECLARTDLFKAVETLRKVLESVGFWWESEIVSRVDMQVLLPVDIYEFTEALKGQRVVTRCRGVYQLNANMNTMRIETITLRSCNAELCIYDKRAQLLTADLVYFRTFCKEILQDGEIPKHLTRVEFRFRRRML